MLLATHTDGEVVVVASTMPPIFREVNHLARSLFAVLNIRSLLRRHIHTFAARVLVGALGCCGSWEGSMCKHPVFLAAEECEPPRVVLVERDTIARTEDADHGECIHVHKEIGYLDTDIIDAKTKHKKNRK